MRKEIITLMGLAIIIFSVYFVISADTDWPSFNVCCERTINGAWCQNSLEGNCDENYRKTPTSCEATSFCKPGCCIDSEEGLCMKNSPQKVCEISTGSWIDDEICNVAQCELGCCLLGQQASFVTLTRCKRISGVYGLETNFKKEIRDEAECILMAYSLDKGACVYEIEGQKTCNSLTRQECLDSEEKGDADQEVEFFEGYLCSADELATDCGPTRETICVPGKDEVYFKDSCGNPANIYDANKIYSKDPSYWQKIVPKSESCGYTAKNGDGNIKSKKCGNCDYLQGSICGKGNAVYGDYVCKDLNCYNTKNGNNYKNGESWCEYQGEHGEGQDLVGSRHFRHICVQGEEIVEPCADFRNDVCIEEKFGTNKGDFIEAACAVNRWQDCIEQFEKEDCENTDRRDCYWIKGVHYDGTSSDGNTRNLADVNLTDENKGIIKGGGICLPDNPPGLNFWEEGDASGICSLGNSRQIVHYKENIFGSRKCSDNCEVLENEWLSKMNYVCASLGDCGAHSNIAGRYTDGGVLLKINGTRQKIERGILGRIRDNSI